MLEELKPHEVFRWFEEISRIPHCSYKEEKLSSFLVEFAKERKLEWYQDEKKNVIIKKRASKGKEKAPAVILQGHMDMVCEKLADSNHNFDTDPLELAIEEDWLRANNTTLGGDDGIAVSYMLAILDSGEIQHGPLECLFTTSEEMGMEGAFAVTKEHLEGKYLFNIDGEVEGDLLVGCSGGIVITSTHPIEKEKVLGEAKSFRLKLQGLEGGHSGQEIHKSRGNSIKCIGRILYSEVENLRILSLKGGSKHNAIPTNSEAEFLLLGENTEEVLEKIHQKAEEIRKEYSVSDPNFEITIEESTVKKETSWSLETAQEVLKYILAIDDGVIYMDPTFHDLVQTSISSGILSSDGEVKIVTLLRSSVKSKESEIIDRIKVIAEAFHFTVSDDGGYPAWEYDPDSKLRPIAEKMYQRMFNRDPKVKTIHCGLECGILKRVLTDTDMITYGPDMKDIHTVKERLSISSTERMWEFTLALLDKLSRE